VQVGDARARGERARSFVDAVDLQVDPRLHDDKLLAACRGSELYEAPREIATGPISM
jgi:hypothetical protein